MVPSTQSVSSRRRWQHSTLQASFEEFRRKKLSNSANKCSRSPKSSSTERWIAKFRGNVGGQQRENKKNTLVVLPGGGPAIKVRKAKSRPPSERWNVEAIRSVIATPDTRNPKDPSQLDPRSERETSGVDFGVTGGQDLPKQRVQMRRTPSATFVLLRGHSVNTGSRSDAKAAKQNSQEMV